MSSILQPGVTNPLASIFSYNNPMPNPTLGTGAFQMPQVPQLANPAMPQMPISNMGSLGSGTFNMPQGTVAGFNPAFDSGSYVQDLSRFSGGALDGKAPEVDTSGLGLNMPTFQLGLQGLMGLGNLYFANEASGLAKKSFALTKKTAENNYRNTIQSYNTALEDQRNVRGFMEGKSQEQIQQDINRNRLA